MQLKIDQVVNSFMKETQPMRRWNRLTSWSSCFILAGKLSSLSTLVNPVSCNHSETA